MNSGMTSLSAATGRPQARVLRTLLVLAAMFAAEPLPAAEPAPADAAMPTNAPLVRAGAGRLELGQVRIDTRRREIRFPATVNLLDVPLEYLVVSASGKTHESLFRTDAEPLHVQVALLLLGSRGAGTNALPEDPRLPLPGDAVRIEIVWREGRKERRAPAEDFLLNRKTAARMKRGPWIYTGSRTSEGAFAAQRDGSIISLITDADALINNPRPGRENDEAWEFSKAPLPPVGGSVDIVLRPGK